LKTQLKNFLKSQEAYNSTIFRTTCSSDLPGLALAFVASCYKKASPRALRAALRAGCVVATGGPGP